MVVVAFEAMPMAAFLLDAGGDILKRTRRAARLFPGPGPEGPLDHEGNPDTAPPDQSFAALTNLSRADFDAALRDGLASGSVLLPMISTNPRTRGKPVRFHVSLMRAPGQKKPVYLIAQDHLRASTEALRTGNDVRARMSERNEELADQILQLQSAILSMDSFTHAVSHDLRTPLNAVSGLLELFEKKFAADLPDSARTYLDHMQRATQQMDDLTSKLLLHARSSGGPMDLSAVTLSDEIDAVLQSVDATDRLQAQRVSVSGASFELIAEPTMLRILLTNLLSNALKHRAADRPLEVDIIVTAEGAGARLEVRDTGTGFDPKQSDAIFQPFQRLNPKIAGTGIGLATCAEICRRHGWSLRATSDGETGACFTVVFPAVRSGETTQVSLDS